MFNTIVVGTDGSSTADKAVARGDLSVVPALAKLAATGAQPLGRLHALWALEGLKSLDDATLLKGFEDADPRVRIAALRTSSHWRASKPVPTLPANTKSAASK